jgi:hypothetical protein
MVMVLLSKYEKYYNGAGEIILSITFAGFIASTNFVL